MRYLQQVFLLFCILLTSSVSFGQFCSGSLGAPVINITFGSGSNYGPPLGVTVPGASTTYPYVTTQFGDGSYTIANQVLNNPAWFGGAGDHTGDPNGYMAFFNSDPTPGGEFYRQTINDLCPGTTYEFAFWVANVVNANILPGGIPPNITFNILNPVDNSVIATSNTGDIANNTSMTWKQYSILFKLPAGVNGAILVLTNNNVGGNAQPGNDLAIDDITFRACGPATNASFSNTVQVNSISVNTCSTVNVYGKITGNFNNPTYQWQISKDGGVSFSDIPGATTLNAFVSGLTDGLYELQLLSAEPGNINSVKCRFISNKINLLVTGCNTFPAVQNCKGALEFRGEDAVTLPAPESVYYSANGFTWECWFNGSWYNNNDATIGLGHSLLMTGDEIPCEDIQIGFGWRNVAKNRLCFAVDETGMCNNLDANPCTYIPPGGFIANKWYHVAGVKKYNTNETQLYVDGQLVDTKPNFKQPYTRDILTFIGRYPNRTDSGFVGKVDEIRYWNYPRTVSEIQADYDKCLTGKEPGLVAYFKANESSGLVAYDATTFQRNGTLEPVVSWANNSNAPLVSNCFSKTNTLSVSICKGQSYNGYNTTGTYIDTFYFSGGCDSIRTLSLSVTDCSPAIKSIINTYTPVIAFYSCLNKITVKDASTFNPGDTVLLIQMKGAAIDSSNTASFGTITDYKNAGNYEFNYVKAKAGNVIELTNIVTRQYDLPDGKVQLIRVPYFKSVVISDTLTCLPWDGEKGGVLVLNVRDTITLGADINVSKKGFTVGAPVVNSLKPCNQNDYFYSSPANAGEKGEGISSISVQKKYGKGSLANGGGGGNSDNCGGGGGANGGNGGSGGRQWQGCSPDNVNGGGIGGNALANNTVLNKLYMGGGGGTGHTNDNIGYFPAGKGGGICIILANTLINSNNGKVLSNGGDGFICPFGNNCTEGVSGGGSGGSILFNVPNIPAACGLEAKGGKGADNSYNDPILYPGKRLGTGGGGGGGFILLSQNTVNPLLTATTDGGLNGVNTAHNNDPHGSTPGQNGKTINSFQVNISSTVFKPNIDSVRINATLTSCNAFGFKGLGYTNRNAIQSWQWNFGDGSVANVQNTSHTYNADGNFNVKLVATDINGCKDSITISVKVQNCLSSSPIINDYTPALSFNSCNNKLTVKDASSFKTGDTVLLIQMKGAVIDDRNLSSFGDISNYKNAGNYEFNYIKGKAGNVVELKNVLTKKYDIPDGKVQLIRVPWFQSVTISDTLTCLPWDGEKGGVVVLNAANTVTLNAPIDVSSKGFRGGGAGTGFYCGSNDWAVNPNIAGIKGEGITEYIPGKDAGGAKLANGGGGGFGGNTGAGGGGNFGAGGTGGKEYNLCGSFSKQSIGGLALDYNGNTKVFLGGGGGGGQQDNGQLVLPGGKGGGLIIVKAASLNSNNQKITANGETFSIIIQDEGGNGGGAGGSILMDVNNYSGSLQLQADGGAGSSNNNVIFAADCHGPGGGGGGGYIAFSKAALPAGVNSSFTGGAPGMVLNPVSACFNSTYGAESGAAGGMKFNVALPQDGTVFKTNIDSVIFKDSATVCRSFDFKGSAFTQRDAIQNWDWDFADGGTGTTQNISHTYLQQGGYTVKLIATDINGCKDSITKAVTVVLPVITAGADKIICRGKQVQLSASGAVSYKWQPATGLNDDAVANPIASPPDTTQYIVTGTVTAGCTVNDTVIVFIIPSPVVTKTNDTLICEGKPVQLFVSGADSYVWSPANTLNNANIPNPIASPVVNTTYYVQSTSAAFNCSATDSVKVSLKKPGIFSIAPGGSVCSNTAVQLSAFGGDEYVWSPAGLVSNPTASSTRATPIQTTTFSVKIKDLVCNDSAILNTTVVAIPLPQLTVTKSNDVDCFTDTVQLNVTGADLYLWTSDQAPLYLNDPRSANPIAYLKNAKIYYVTGTNTTTGCINKDTINIAALANANKPFYAPNAFSPNGDGHNDCYKLFTNGLLQGFEMAIYNRYGELVFTTSNPTDCWDGKYKGKLQDPGNFVVYIRATNKCVRGVTKSNLVLIR